MSDTENVQILSVEQQMKGEVADGKEDPLQVIAGLQQRFAEQEQLVRQREKEIEDRTRALLDALYDAKKYLLILEQADLIVMLLDGASRRFVYFNKRSEDVFGFPRDDILRKETPEVLNLIPLVRDAALFGDEFEKLLSDNNIFRSTFAFTSKTKAQGAVRLTISKFIEEGGGFLYVLLGEDITREREAERFERRRTEETERLNQLMIGRELRMIELKKEISELSMQCDAFSSK